VDSHAFNSATDQLFCVRGPLESQVASQLTSCAQSPRYEPAQIEEERKEEAYAKVVDTEGAEPETELITATSQTVENGRKFR